MGHYLVKLLTIGPGITSTLDNCALFDLTFDPAINDLAIILGITFDDFDWVVTVYVVILFYPPTIYINYFISKSSPWSPNMLN
jgi:hypothetical protein